MCVCVCVCECVCVCVCVCVRVNRAHTHAIHRNIANIIAHHFCIFQDKNSLTLALVPSGLGIIKHITHTLL